MKSTRLFLLLVCMLLFLLFLSVTTTVAIDNSENHSGDMKGDDDDDDVEIHNIANDAAHAISMTYDESVNDQSAVPDLHDSDDDEEEDVDDNFEHENGEEEEEEEETAGNLEVHKVKSVLQGALSRSSDSSNSTTSVTAALLLARRIMQHHYRGILTTSLMVYAFRREIYNCILYFCCSQPSSYINMETGEIVRRRLALPSFSSILQVLLVVHLAWTLLVAPYFYKKRSLLQQNGNFTQSAASSSSSSYSSGAVFEDDDMDAAEQDDNNTAMVSTVLSLLLWLMGGRSIGGMNPIALTLILSNLFSSGGGRGSMRNPTYIPPIEQHYTFERINERYIKDGMALQKAMGTATTSSSKKNDTIKAMTTPARRRPWQTLNPSAFLHSQHASQQQQQHQEPYNATVIVMDLTSAHVTQTSILRDQVSFLLSEYRKKALLQTTTTTTTAEAQSASGSSVHTTSHCTLPEDGAEMEVVVLLESPGGSASDYALAAQQILRLRREPGITVTIAVDKVAASGGYMIACTSSPGRLLAAPFAVLGSIGVVGQTINVHKALEGWGVQPLVFRGGRDKAPVGLLGEVTQQGLAKVQDMVDDTHRAFKRFVAESRPAVANRIEDVATGDVWLGYDALEQGLIDRIVTSDEYIGEKMAQGARILKLVLFKRGSFPFQRPSSTSEPVSMATTALCSNSSSSLKNLVGLVVLQFASRIRSVLERFAVSLLAQQPALPGFGGGSDGFVDLVQDNQLYMIHSKTAVKATATLTSSSSPSL